MTPSLEPELAAALPFTRHLVRVPLAEREHVDLHLLEHGDPRGRPVVLLHGNRSWSVTWRHVLRCRPELRLLAVDLPGFGLSSPLPARRRTLAAYGDAIARLLEQLGIAEAVFVAHEAGGLIAAAAARRADRLFAGGVLVASAVLPTGAPVPPTLHRFGRWLRMRDLVFAVTGWPPLALEALQANRAAFAASCVRLYSWPLASRARRRAMVELAALAAAPAARIASGEWLLRFPGPLALVWGHADPLMTPADFATQEAELPYARRWATEAGHFVQEEEPGAVSDAIAWAAERVGKAADPEGIPANFLPGIGSGDFVEVGRDQARRLVDLGALRPADRILDVGCGLGRTALALRDLLGPRGRYDGLDVVREVVRWCQQNLTRVDPRLRFHHAPVRNDLYNPAGSIEARDYRFPFEDGVFDSVIAGSLFTHLPAEDAQHYLAEIARVLRRGGTLWATAFLLDASAREAIAAGRADHRFQAARGAAWVDDPEQPLLAVAFERDWFLDAVASAGLEPVEPPAPGTWRGAEDTGFYQDIVVARRRA